MHVFVSQEFPGVGIPHLLMAFPSPWYWGSREALLFLIYSLALTSLYLAAELFLLGGLPFVNPVRLATQAIIVPVMLLGGMGGAVLAFLQWLIFRSYTAAVIATATVALLAVVVVRFSPSHLISEFQTNLLPHLLGLIRLFKILDYD